MCFHHLGDRVQFSQFCDLPGTRKFPGDPAAGVKFYGNLVQCYVNIVFGQILGISPGCSDLSQLIQVTREHHGG